MRQLPTKFLSLKRGKAKVREHAQCAISQEVVPIRIHHAYPLGGQLITIVDTSIDHFGFHLVVVGRYKTHSEHSSRNMREKVKRSRRDGGLLTVRRVNGNRDIELIEERE